MTATRADQIREALAALQPEHLDVVDESHMHSRGLETHYKAVVVSTAFEGKRPLQRHQAVYGALGDLMGTIHALGLHTYTPAEWADGADVPDSPRCRGGSKHDPVADG